MCVPTPACVTMEKVIFENKQVPLHYQIADYLLVMLKKGNLPINERIPPEEKLTGVFGVSRMTVRRAIDHLLQKGLVMRKQGKGTFWTSDASSVIALKPSGINRQIFNISEETYVAVLSKTKETSSHEVAAFLGIPDESEVVVFKRIRSIKGEPMSFTVNYLPISVGGRIEKKHLETMTMLETLESVIHIDLGIVEHVVEITRASAEIAKYLGISVLDPVLTVRTYVFDSEKKPVEIVWTHFVENRYRFRVVLDK